MIIHNSKNYLILYHTKMDTFTLCPNCTDCIPLLLLEPDNKINIFCDCGYANSFPLHEYLTLYSTRAISNTYFNQCPIHNLPFLAYCLTCGTHVCSFCWEHEEHLQKSIKNDELYVENIIVEISEATYHLKDYLLTLANKFSNNRKVMSSYYQCYNRNNDILSFFLILIAIHNKIGDNYYLNKNIESNININIYKCNKEDSSHIISYFKNFTINRKQLKSTVIQKIKDINEYFIQKVYAMMLLNNGEILVCLHNFIKIFEPNKNYCSNYLLNKQYINNVVSACQLDNNLIAINISKKGILLLDLNKVNKIMVIPYPVHITINSVVALPSECLAIASNDKKISIYLCQPPNTKRVIRTLEGHSEGVLSLLFLESKKLLLSNSVDLSLRIWSTITYQCISVIFRFYFSPKKNIIVPFDNNSLIIGYLNILSIMDLSTGQTEKLFSCKDISDINTVIAMEDVVICGCEEGKLVVIDKITKKYIIIQTESNKAITQLLKVNEREFLSLCENSITIWKC